MFNCLFSLSWCRVTVILLCAQFLFGISLIAILPPFEGIDETAAFSAIQSHDLELSPTAAAPGSDNIENLRQSMSMEVFDYYRRAPMPYHWVAVDIFHKDDSAKKYLTYGDFSHRSRQFKESYITGYTISPLPDVFNPSPETNWERPNPAIFENIMTPIIRHMAGHASLVSILFMLRLFSYSMAFFGFCIGLFATKSFLKKSGVLDAELITTLGALYPFLMPAYFWEFARLSNDGLCLFLFSILWVFLLRYARSYVYGLFVILLALLFYGLDILHTHAPHDVAWNGIMDGFITTVKSAVWLYGSWSHFVINFHAHLLLLFFAVIVVLSYLLAAHQRSNKSFFIPIIVIGVMLSILFVAIALGADNEISGASLHILAPAWAMIFGSGLSKLMSKQRIRFFVAILFIPIVLLNFFIAWSYASAFSGCVMPLPINAAYRLQLPDILRCAKSFHSIMDQLSIIAWPHVAIITFGATFCLLILAAFMSVLTKHKNPSSEPQI